ncbi:MAG: indolepyruvate oxidoreductase subunit beta [Marinilabiliaceae bacterium]|nr:indolepyruvate oxidoreductase subunit beta [Marinilabiliaceae bacterium]
MKRDIILSGVGGQGILSIATIIGDAAMNKGMFIKQAEVHGMSQRGGDVHSHLRISDEQIASDLIGIGCADLIISMEPMEALRYKPSLKKGGWIVTSKTPFVNIPNYPDVEKIYEELRKIGNVILVDAEEIAKANQMSRSVNMILLGAAADALGLDVKTLSESVARIFGAKGKEIVEMNVRALQLGAEQK